jgi:catechol 2,3-dioxygenase-like lactoylglutathione lyase family enzyme
LMNAPGEPERFSHSGICVGDIAASMAFYARLGFKPAENYVLDEGAPWLAVINEVPGIKLRAQMMRDEYGNIIELLQVFQPVCFGPREMQAMNRFGLSHMVIEDDPSMDAVDIFHRADPDGVRIEFRPPMR